jgi:hypothetical protein
MKPVAPLIYAAGEVALSANQSIDDNLKTIGDRRRGSL